MMSSVSFAPFVPYKTLIIVESPSKCKTIEHMLGPTYMCVATCGHIRDLAIQPDMSNVSEMLSSERIPYTKSSKKMAHIRTIQNALSKCNGTVILATDADREGESIAWHVCQVFGLPVETTPRIVFKEITQTAIRTALDAPVRINMNLVRAQQTRQVLDFIIGYGITPLLWTWLKTGANMSTSMGMSMGMSTNNKNKNNKVVQSAGRCQSPALRIMQEAYNEMRDAESNPDVQYKCVGYFTKFNIPFTMTARLKTGDDVDAFLRFYTESDTRQTIAAAHRFELSQPSLVSYKPPPPLKSTTLQQLGSTYLRLTPTETMDAAQHLYEAGYITYHRTDSTCLSEEFKTVADDFIKSNWNTSFSRQHASSTSSKSTVFESTVLESTRATASDHAHEAIRPVNITTINLPDEDRFEKAERVLYSFIWMRAVCSCMCDATYEKITATVCVSGSYTYAYTYNYNAYRQKMTGWRACTAQYGTKLQPKQPKQPKLNCDSDDMDTDDDIPNTQQSSDHFSYLQSIVPGSSLPYNSIECYPVLVNAFVPYTYTKLLHRLEKMGIGRPSTFASIIHTLKKRDYICETSTSRPISTSTSVDCGDDDDSTYPYTYNKYKITTQETITDAVTSKSLNKKNSNPTRQRGNQIQITQHGQAVIDALFPTCEPLLAYQYTREMEETLDNIAQGNTYWVDVCKKCINQVDKLKQETGIVKVKPEPNSSGVRRQINEHASIRDGKFGSAYIYFRTPAMKKPKFIALKGFPYSYMECDANLLLDWIDSNQCM